MLYTIYINISQSMLYYDGVKKTFFLPHIFLKRAMAELICRRSFFARTAMRMYKKKWQPCLHGLGLLLVYSRSVATMPERSSGIWAVRADSDENR